jgi:hypothetical protein
MIDALPFPSAPPATLAAAVAYVPAEPDGTAFAALVPPPDGAPDSGLADISPSMVLDWAAVSTPAPVTAPAAGDTVTSAPMAKAEVEPTLIAPPLAAEQDDPALRSGRLAEAAEADPPSTDQGAETVSEMAQTAPDGAPPVAFAAPVTGPSTIPQQRPEGADRALPSATAAPLPVPPVTGRPVHNTAPEAPAKGPLRPRDETAPAAMVGAAEGADTPPDAPEAPLPPPAAPQGGPATAAPPVSADAPAATRTQPAPSPEGAPPSRQYSQAEPPLLPPHAQSAVPSAPDAVPLADLPALLVARAGTVGTAEILLSPAELGPIRFEISGDANDLHLTLSAEQDGTADLLRRHAAELVAEFRQAGFAQVSVGFGLWSQGGGRGGQSPPQLATAPVSAIASPPASGIATGPAAIATALAPALQASRPSWRKSLNLRL